MERCGWAETGDELLAKYHDEEWGVPNHDDRKHFEFMILEAFQAGLSWMTILRKREAFRKAFAGFDPSKVAKFDQQKVNELLNDKGIVRNRLKIEAAINNAKRFLEVQKEFGSFDNYIWGFVEGKPIAPDRRSLSEIPATTELSDRISQDLKKRGFKFVGSTIVYSHLQAVGIVNDHLVDCPRYRAASQV
ncbi:DNA-3-methyladenine glycosylase I [Dehalogenimonas formicexedens]|uniref:DNA-3-methyladenine glycosylase I n=1 Tax=Dehalogenimonas formicexedens TaxID=1839801 RepID=A0A1P8F608_9CHLR|nr:DNA-3-methyladenine glycosylase I [Dehalogenimonas formicexedens]APV43911.1 DNA-3-methyladenine glycosylase I [Dehalogenimonas formicexedens]